MPFGGDDAESYYDDGLTLSMRGEVDEAAQCFRKAIELDPRFTAAYHQLAKCMFRKGERDQAIGLLVRVVQSSPNLAPARVDLGNALMSAERLTDAEEQFGAALEIDPNNSRAMLGLAELAFYRGDWAAAQAQAAGSIEVSGPAFPAVFLQGRAAKLAGNQEAAAERLHQADELIEKSIEVAPKKPEGYYLRGEVSFAREKFSSALEQFRAAQDRSVSGETYSAYGTTFTLADILVKQGLCEQRLGHEERAKELGEKALKLAPDHRLARSLVQ